MRFWRFIVLFAFLALVFSPAARAQQDGEEHSLQKGIERGKDLMRRSRFQEAESILSSLAVSHPDDPDIRFYLSMSRALQGRYDEAMKGFLRVLSIDPRRADACFEIAGILMKDQRNLEAFRWVQRGLRLAPNDEYGLDLAGTLCFLSDNKLEALAYWNRLNRPHLTTMTISPGRLDRYSIAEEIDLRPGSLITPSSLEEAAWRLTQHDCIRAIQLNPVPGTSPDAYSLEASVVSRSGFGDPVELLLHSLGDIAFETLNVSYWDLFHKGMTLHMPLRWNSQARWFRFELQDPRPMHYPVYLRAGYEWRDEYWRLAPGERAPDFRLRTHEIDASLLFPIKAPALAATLDLAYRKRDYSGAGTPTAAETGRNWSNAPAAFWVGVSPSIRLLAHSSPVGWSPDSRLELSFHWGRYYNTGRSLVSRFSAGWMNSLRRTSASGLGTSFELGLHVGRLSPDGLPEDHFLLGVGPDAEFSLRAHPVFRDGGKGLTPMAGDFALANFTVRQDFYKWSTLRFGVIGFADTARVWRPLAGQPEYGTLFDAGGGIEIGFGPLSRKRLTIAYGRDFEEDRNSLYVGANFP